MLEFSESTSGVFDGQALFQRSGPWLKPLRDAAYFQRCFIDASALCWHNGLELSAAHSRPRTRLVEAA